MKDLEKSLKALANRRRLAIITYLKKHREAPVKEVAGAIRLSFKATSKHLNILAGVDILEKDQRSLQMFYRLAPTQKPGIKHIIYLL
ncbi:winged helix-turn-helix transcriptional regulator [Candidatus Azambacteria bacterium]|nr:winged helix-turn-helix transcriptional regulator [Candidatus Azambacteria bacterium]